MARGRAEVVDPSPHTTSFMKTTLHTILLSASLAAGMSGALAQTGADLVILPAPAAAWRIIVGSWGNQAELTSDSVVAPGPNPVGAIARGYGVLREAVLLDWKNHWATMLRFESR